MAQPGPMTALTYTVPRADAGWELYEGKMPVTPPHARAVDLLMGQLEPWAAARGGSIHYDLAVRWVEENKRIGVNPDISVLVPTPSNLDEAGSVCTWMPGHAPPVLGIEIVSKTNWKKDYSIGPQKFAASGTQELWILDPQLFAPKSYGGPFLIQVWRRDEHGFSRIYAGDGPVFSPILDAYLVATADKVQFRIAKDEAVTEFWLTKTEAAELELERLKAEITRLKGG